MTHHNRMVPYTTPVRGTRDGRPGRWSTCNHNHYGTGVLQRLSSCNLGGEQGEGRIIRVPESKCMLRMVRRRRSFAINTACAIPEAPLAAAAMKQCASCGAIGYASDTFCAACGAALAEPKPDRGGNPPAISCPFCGDVSCHPIAFYCSRCGAPLLKKDGAGFISRLPSG